MTDAQPSGRGTAQPAWADRFRGAMLGGAVGDAVGSGVRTLPLDGIRSFFGSAGIRSYVPVFGRRGAASDVSQLTVFTLDGLLRAKAANPGGDAWLPTEYVGVNYLRWLHTQGVPWEYAMSAHLAREPRPAGWLLERAELASTRNPGGPALTMVGKMAERFPIGPDGLLRPHFSADGLAACAAWAAPAMVWSPTLEVVHATAAATANLFTSGSNALGAAGLHSDVLAQLLRGIRLWDAVTAADLNRLGSTYRVGRMPADVRRTVHAAMFLGQRGLPVRPEDLDVEFDVDDEPGEIGIALAAVSSTRTFADAVLTAVNHSGDSSVTGVLAGQLAGAIHGPAGIPREWLDELELRGAVEILCQDAAEAFAPQRPRWAERYMPNASSVSVPELPSAPGRTVEGVTETTMVLPAIGARPTAPKDSADSGAGGNAADFARPPRVTDNGDPARAVPATMDAERFPTGPALTGPAPTGPAPIVTAEPEPETTAVFPAVTDSGPETPADETQAELAEDSGPVQQPVRSRDVVPSARERPRHQPASSWLGDEDKPAPSWLSAPGKPAFAAFIEQAAQQQEEREQTSERSGTGWPETANGDGAEAVDPSASAEWFEPADEDVPELVDLDSVDPPASGSSSGSGGSWDLAKSSDGAGPPDSGEPLREPVDLQPPPRTPIDLEPEPGPADESVAHRGAHADIDVGTAAPEAEDNSTAGGSTVERPDELDAHGAGIGTAADTDVRTDSGVGADAGGSDEVADIGSAGEVIEDGRAVPPQEFVSTEGVPSGDARAVLAGHVDLAGHESVAQQAVGSARADEPVSTTAPETTQGARPSRGEHAKDEDPGAGAPSLTECVLGCLLAGAVGDALGAELASLGADEGFDHDGQDGPRNLRGRISDNTQLTLFTVEGLVRGSVAGRMFGSDDPLPEVQLAYQRWLHTQGVEWAVAVGGFADEYRTADGWLIEVPGLFASREPGRTVFDALLSFGSGGPAGSLTEPVNDSKGCGGVVRSAPVALWSADPADVFLLAVRTAALTHSHPAGYHSAGALAVIVQQALLGRGLDDGVWLALQVLETWEDSEQTAAMLTAAVELAEEGVPEPERLAEVLGSDSTAEQALAIAVCAALIAGEDVQLALRIATGHDGNTAATGAICGNIAGALHGVAALPVDWLADLELRDVVQQVALDCVAEFGGAEFQSGAAIDPPDDAEWQERYPVRDPLGAAQRPTREDSPETTQPDSTRSDVVDTGTAVAEAAETGMEAGRAVGNAGTAGQGEDDVGAFPAPKPAPRRVLYERDDA